MQKKYSKGFTLIELIISITIFTIVISIGYKIINNSNFMFKTQANTAKQQMTINNLNKFLSKDIQYSTNIEGPIFSTKKLNGSEYTLENIEKNENIDYEYKITNNKNEIITYIVSINDDKYSIYRYENNGPKLNLVYNEKLELEDGKLNAPLIIQQDLDNKLLYYVNLQSNNKKNNNYSFQVASRYKKGTVNVDSSLDNNGEAGEYLEKPNDFQDLNPNQNLIFEYKKLDKISYSEDYNWNYKVKFKLDEYTDDKSSNKPNGILFSDQFVIRRYGDQIDTFISSWNNSNVKYTNFKVSQIKGFILKFEDDMEIKNVTFMDKNYGDLNESNKKYTFNLTGNMQNVKDGNLLTGTVKINDSSNKDGVYRIEIEFIY